MSDGRSNCGIKNSENEHTLPSWVQGQALEFTTLEKLANYCAIGNKQLYFKVSVLKRVMCNSVCIQWIRNVYPRKNQMYSKWFDCVFKVELGVDSEDPGWSLPGLRELQMFCTRLAFCVYIILSPWQPITWYPSTNQRQGLKNGGLWCYHLGSELQRDDAIQCEIILWRSGCIFGITCGFLPVSFHCFCFSKNKIHCVDHRQTLRSGRDRNHVNNMTPSYQSSSVDPVKFSLKPENSPGRYTTLPEWRCGVKSRPRLTVGIATVPSIS